MSSSQLGCNLQLVKSRCNNISDIVLMFLFAMLTIFTIHSSCNCMRLNFLCCLRLSDFICDIEKENWEPGNEATLWLASK